MTQRTQSLFEEEESLLEAFFFFFSFFERFSFLLFFSCRYAKSKLEKLYCHKYTAETNAATAEKNLYLSFLLFLFDLRAHRSREVRMGCRGCRARNGKKLHAN